MGVYIGIDPGLGGAVSVLTHSGRILFADTPVVKIKVGKSIKQQMDVAEAVRILEKIQRHATQEQTTIHVTMEKVNAMAVGGRTMGATSAFNFGMGFGMWQGILAAMHIPYTLVTPQSWKKAMIPDSTKEKGASILRVKQLYPQTAKDLTRVKDHGRADAFLICEYGRRITSGYFTQELPTSQSRKRRSVHSK